MSPPPPLRGGGQLHPHFPSIEIAIPQAEHLGILLFFGFAEPGAAFDPLFRLAELGPSCSNSDGRRRLLDFTDFLLGERLLGERLLGERLLGERLYFGRPRSSQQSLTSLAVG